LPIKALANFVPTGIWQIKTLVKVLKKLVGEILADSLTAEPIVLEQSPSEIPYVKHVIANF